MFLPNLSLPAFLHLITGMTKQFSNSEMFQDSFPALSPFFLNLKIHFVFLQLVLQGPCLSK